MDPENWTEKQGNLSYEIRATIQPEKGKEGSMQRKVHSAEFKAKVVLEALKEQKTINEIAGVFKVHPTQVSQWKRQALAELSQLFSQKRGRQAKEQEELKMALYQEIGQLKFELDWVKKKMGILR